MKILLLIISVFSYCVVSGQSLKQDKIDYQYVPPQNVVSLSNRLDSVYKRHGITLPQLSDSLGWLQIRLLSIDNDIIYGLYQRLPKEFGEPTKKSDGSYLWKDVRILGVEGLVDFDFKFYGVSSYTSTRGTSLLTQLVWVNISDTSGKDLIPTSNENYVRLVHFLKDHISYIKPVVIPDLKD